MTDFTNHKIQVTIVLEFNARLPDYLGEEDISGGMVKALVHNKLKDGLLVRRDKYYLAQALLNGKNIDYVW